MYHRILVALDGSPISEIALLDAIKLAKALASQLRLVHVVDELSSIWFADGYANLADIWETMAKAGRDILEKAAVIAVQAGLETETRLIEIKTPGLRIPEILAKEAESWPADLIVAGTHGRRGLNHVLLGSVAEGIVRVSTKPVLLIRGVPSSR